MFSKRKRSCSWDDFIGSVATTVDRDYPQINKIETLPLCIVFYFATIARIPFRLFGAVLAHETYSGSVALNMEQGKPNTVLRVNYSENAKHSRTVRATSHVLQSPKKFMEEDLKLRNAKAIAAVERIIQDVRDYFPSQLDWGNAPYTIIYHKKHNQIIIRFCFEQNSFAFDLSGDCASLAKSWIEYNKRLRLFYLVSVVNNCI